LRATRSRQPFGPSAADLLELAVAGGDLVPGARGWKMRQQELVQAHMDAPRAELLGQSLAAVIVSERAETWVSTCSGQTRQRIVGAVANRLAAAHGTPGAGSSEPAAPGGDGCWQNWTTGYPSPRPVTSAGRSSSRTRAGSGGDVSRPPPTEDELYDLHQLRCLAGELRLAGRSGRVLTLTGKGRRLLADPGRVGAGNLVAAR
jgi:hypothetical protein